jgi:uncharacterized protein YyaL (SSP411 family)
MATKNALQFESSLYLQQHANNPVHWRPWHASAFADAQKQNKLVLISIGYAACHWCHVMEHESFTDVTISQAMNTHFICIKVDREEHTDVDQVYMQALQLMTGSGGWPLNILALPDGRPIYGGTYFPPNKWLESINAIANFYSTKTDLCLQYADELAAGLTQMINFKPSSTENWTVVLDNAVSMLANGFDVNDGGFNRSPKFPMPGIFSFLLLYGKVFQKPLASQHVVLTLTKMALGGIYDQLGGGFSRYATDMKWKVPHFEKMLYDNVQLISTYCEAYQFTKNNLFKKTVVETISFLNKNMFTEGGYCAAIDADSEGVEGKYYTWNLSELKSILADDFEWFANYYQVNESGYWEHDRYILCCKHTMHNSAVELNLNPDEFELKINSMRNKVLAVRNKRVPPALDDKKITAWNALAITALVDSYLTFHNPSYLETAIKTANFICDNLWVNNELYHTYKNNKVTIPGYLDDYACTAQAFLKLYEASGNSQWIVKAKALTTAALKLFASSQALFYYNQKNEILFSRPLQISDDVLPSGNSMLAKCLFQLGHYYGDVSYIETAINMVAEVISEIKKYPAAYAHWLKLLQYINQPFYEICFSGPNAFNLYHDFKNQYQMDFLPVLILSDEDYVWSKNKFNVTDTIYICQQGVCHAPVKTIKEALNFIKTRNDFI